MGAGGEQQAAGAVLGKVELDQRKIICIVKNQQPGLLALLQPAFDCGNQLALILVLFRGNIGEQFREFSKTGQDRLFASSIDPEDIGIAVLLTRMVGIFDCDLRLDD